MARSHARSRQVVHVIASTRFRMRTQRIALASALFAALAAAYPSAQDRPAPVTARRLAQNPLVTHHVVAIARRQRQRALRHPRARMGRTAARPLLHVFRPPHGRLHPPRLRGSRSKVHGGFTSLASCRWRTRPSTGRSPTRRRISRTSTRTSHHPRSTSTTRTVVWSCGSTAGSPRGSDGRSASRRHAPGRRRTATASTRRRPNLVTASSFAVRPPITRTSYLRVFARGAPRVPRAGCDVPVRHGAARAAAPIRPTRSALFEPGPNPFAGGPYAGRVRHVALLQRGTVLYVFFTAIGDDPERVMMTTIDASGDWTAWRTTEAVELLRPEAPYECPNLPAGPSAAGDVKGPVRQMQRSGGLRRERPDVAFLFDLRRAGNCGGRT